MKTWISLKRHTQARIGLGQAGASMPTAQLLPIRAAEALARDALYRTWDLSALQEFLKDIAWPMMIGATEVGDRRTYLARPDLGRRLAQACHDQFLKRTEKAGKDFDPRIVICLSDGLSAQAMDRHAIPFLKVLLPRLQAEEFYSGIPCLITLLPFSRVAAADAVGVALKSELSVILVGERPGLSAHDSMGIYLSYNPTIEKSDGEKNCISNIRPPDGMGYSQAADQLLYLIRESLRRKLSGVDLKMEETKDANEFLPVKIIESPT